MNVYWVLYLIVIYYCVVKFMNKLQNMSVHLVACLSSLPYLIRGSAPEMRALMLMERETRVFISFLAALTMSELVSVFFLMFST